MGLISRVSSRTYRCFHKMQISNSSPSNFYQVLGVKSSASETEIKKSFHKLARELHPDKQTNQPDHIKDHTQELFKQVKQAYETLIDPKTRCKYDNQQKLEDIKLREEKRKSDKAESMKQERLKKQAKDQERYLKKMEQRRAKARAHIQAKEEAEREKAKYEQFLRDKNKMYRDLGNMHPAYSNVNNLTDLFKQHSIFTEASEFDSRSRDKRTNESPYGFGSRNTNSNPFNGDNHL